MHNLSDDLGRLALRLGDSCLVLSQRLTDWCGVGPELEEDVSLSNLALDLLGEARLWLTLAAKLEGRGRGEDELAFLREGDAYLNLLLVEQPNGNFAHTQVRQFLFDAWHMLVLQALVSSADQAVAAIASKAVKEARYHVARSSRWVICLGDGTAHSHALAQNALDDLWDYIGEFFEMDDTEHRLLALGLGCDQTAVREAWFSYVRDVLADATLSMPNRLSLHTGGRHGLHTEHLGALLAEMQYLQRVHPGAQW